MRSQLTAEGQNPRLQPLMYPSAQTLGRIQVLYIAAVEAIGAVKIF